MTTVQHQIISESEYLHEEINSEIKHEYIQGNVVAMAGASKNHERICLNIVSEFRQHLKKSPCEPFGSDVKIKTPVGNFRYPDAMVVCEDDDHQYFTESPVILIEVLSRSTRKTDEQTKRLEYINIPSLLEYVMIEQDFVDVEVLRQSDDWRSSHYFLGDDIYFESIDLTLSVAEIYDRVKNDDMTDWLMEQKES